MLHADVALIGGTGVGERLTALGGDAVVVPTPYGALRGRLVAYDGLSLFLVQRHSAGHSSPPHKVGYKAMAVGLAALGVKVCLSTAAVGSLHEDWPVGTLAVCTGALDLSARNLTLFDDSVRHTDMTRPFPASGLLLKACENMGEAARPEACYVCANGPRYETPSEIQAMKRLGGDVVGMTASSEAVLMREAGVPYGCLAIVTNLAAGLSQGELAHGDVSAQMRTVGERVVKVLLEAAKLASNGG